MYDEENNRKVLSLNVNSEDEVYSYAEKKKFKVIDIKERRLFFKRKKLKIRI